MKKLIVYFHGYGSSSNSDKVVRLRQEKDFEVHAFDADIDPVVAYKSLSENINMMLATDPHVPVKLVFVGTSLGGWWACKMAKDYSCHAVIINPSVSPSLSLQKYGVPMEICEKYHAMAPFEKHKYYFAEHDEVIDNRQFRTHLINADFDVTVVEGADHRFGGAPFEQVIDYLKGL